MSSLENRLPQSTGVIFDFDGTLASTETAVVACAQATARELLGITPDAREIASRMGLPLGQVFAQIGASDPELVRRCVDHYRSHFDAFLPLIVLFPHTIELLSSLRKRGLLLAVASSRGRSSLDVLIDRLQLREYFGAIVGEEDVENKKPHPDAAQLAAKRAGFSSQRAWLVGDTSFDMQMGVAAGCYCIGVTHGSHDAATLANAGAKLLFSRFEDFLSQLSKLDSP